MSVEDIVLIGGGGHALSVADSILCTGRYCIKGYTDKTPQNNSFLYLGTDDVLFALKEQNKVSVAICIGYLGNSDKRDNAFSFVKEAGLELPIIVDPSAIVAKTAKLGEGTYVGKKAVINAGSIVGKMCIINTGAIVEHNNIVADYSHIAVGATLCGDVRVDHHVLVGANSTVLQGVRIGANSIIGAGSTVLADVPENARVMGIWRK